MYTWEDLEKQPYSNFKKKNQSRFTYSFLCKNLSILQYIGLGNSYHICQNT